MPLPDWMLSLPGNPGGGGTGYLPGGTGTNTGVFAGGTTLPTEPKLPDWLSTDVNSLNSELMNQYGNAGSNLFGANRAAKKIDNQKSLMLSSGTQTANNASMDYAARIMQQGGTAAGAGAVKAQAMMPVLKGVADLEVDKQKMLMDAKKAAAARADTLASALSQSRQSYLNTLAGTYTTIRGQNTQFGIAGMNFSGGGGGGGGGGKGGIPPWMGGGDGSFYPGYIPTFGPITPGTGYDMANGHNVLSGYKR